MLDDCLLFLEKRASEINFLYEVIVVSDGSTDNTVDVAHEYSKSYGSDKVRVLVLENNRGKGGAVRLVCLPFNDFKLFLLFETFKRECKAHEVPCCFLLMRMVPQNSLT